MGQINSNNKIEFVSANEIYDKIRRDFNSFGSTNLLDETEWASYVYEVLSRLGVGILKEEQAIVKINNSFIGDLPFDFKELYAAYKCTPSFSSQDNIYPQQVVKMWVDVACSTYKQTKDCEINCCCPNQELVEKIEMRTYIGGENRTMSFVNPILLRLSPNVRPDKRSGDCKNILYSSPFEITITDHSIITNFKNDCVYMQYYAFPYDEDRNPMVPDVEEIKKAIEWWIKYNITLNMFFNESVQNITNKWQKAEQEFDFWFAESKYLLKLPAFNTLVNAIRNKRSINKVSFFSQIDYNRFRY